MTTETKRCVYKIVNDKIVVFGIGNSYYGALRGLKASMSEEDYSSLKLGEITTKAYKQIVNAFGVALNPRYSINTGVINYS